MGVPELRGQSTKSLSIGSRAPEGRSHRPLLASWIPPPDRHVPLARSRSDPRLRTRELPADPGARLRLVAGALLRKPPGPQGLGGFRTGTAVERQRTRSPRRQTAVTSGTPGR